MTKDEIIKFIIDNFNMLPNNKIAEFCNVSQAYVGLILHKNGLSISKQTSWSDTDIEKFLEISQDRTLTIKKMGEILNRSPASVQ